jgi:hypothetical protein
VSYDVRYRVAARNGGFGAYSYPTGWQKTTRPSETLVSSPGHEYCFSVRAHDKAGSVSRWSPNQCTERPVDDRAMSAITPGWTHGSGSAYYLGTYTMTSSYGTELRIAGVYLRTLALVVTRCPNCGSVAIYMNGAYWRTVSTYSATTQHEVIDLQPSFSLRRVTIVLKDVSTGKQLIVEGLGVLQK